MVIVANNTTAQKPLDKKPVKEEKKAEKKDKK